MFEAKTRPLRAQRPRRRNNWPVVAALVVVAVLAIAFGFGQASGETDSGTVVFDRVEQETLHTDQADRQFRSASLVKLLIGLDLVERGIVTPKRPSPRMTRMLSHSDDAIASELWSSGGGPQIVTRVAADLGLSDTEPPDVPGRWGDTLITADDMVKVYQHILALPEAKRALLLDPLRDSARTAADGTDQHFGIPSALSGQPWGVKQAWAAGRGGVDAHTSGLVGSDDRYIVVVLTHHPEGYSLPKAESRVTAEVEELAALLG
ncbi:serine hydrolase [Saccharopolyspora sp. NPDC050389]|uniref:serine hydrolase n=1 Tax=Saccharopolyspora sp. NPDC050389 TaxID=3155516 RepID=UPI0033F1532A